MAHVPGEADNGEHYEVPVDAAGNKTNALGRWLDNLGRGALGGEGVGGDPTDILGVLPQAPTRGVNGDISIGDLNRMREAMPGAVGADPFIGGEDFNLTGEDTDPARGDPGGTVGQQVGPGFNPLEAFGGLGPDGRTSYPPEGQPATGAAIPAAPSDPIQAAVTQAQQTRPDATWANTYTADDALSGVIGGGFEEGDELSNTGAMITAAGIASPLILLLEGAGLGWLATRLGLGGKGAVAPVSRQIGSRFVQSPTRQALTVRPSTLGGGTRPGLTAAGTLGAAAGTNPLLDAITGRDKDALNTQVQ